MRNLTFLALLFSGLAACGGKSIEAGDGPDDRAGSSNLGGGGSGGSTNVGGTINVGGKTNVGGQVGVAGTGVAGSGQAGSSSAICDGFVDESASFIGVDIINQTSTVLYLGQPKVTCEVEPLFSVADGSGSALPSLSRCRSGCGSGVGGCTAICLFPAATQLAPGAVLHTSWDALYDTQVNLPAACLTPGEQNRQCQQAKHIAQGTYSFSAIAGTSISCDETTSCDDGCKVDSEGNCTTQGALISGVTHTATATVLLDGNYGIYTKTLPLPNPQPGAGEADAPALKIVQIIFKD